MISRTLYIFSERSFLDWRGMSRSRKKHPIIKCAGDKGFKKIFNRRFRRQNDLDFPSGNAYRKTNSQWELWDYVAGYFTKDEVPDEPRKYWYSMK